MMLFLYFIWSLLCIALIIDGDNFCNSIHSSRFTKVSIQMIYLLFDRDDCVQSIIKLLKQCENNSVGACYDDLNSEYHHSQIKLILSYDR